MCRHWTHHQDLGPREQEHGRGTQAGGNLDGGDNQMNTVHLNYWLSELRVNWTTWKGKVEKIKSRPGELKSK